MRTTTSIMKIVLSLLLAFALILPLTATAAGLTPAQAKAKSRFSAVLKDTGGIGYTVFMLPVKDKTYIAKATASGTVKGDRIYEGSYQFALQKSGSKLVQVQSGLIVSYTFNATRKAISITPAKAKGQSDILVMKSLGCSKCPAPKMYTVKAGKLTAVTSLPAVPAVKFSKDWLKLAAQGKLYGVDFPIESQAKDVMQKWGSVGSTPEGEKLLFTYPKGNLYFVADGASRDSMTLAGIKIAYSQTADPSIFTKTKADIVKVLGPSNDDSWSKSMLAYNTDYCTLLFEFNASGRMIAYGLIANRYY